MGYGRRSSRIEKLFTKIDEIKTKRQNIRKETQKIAVVLHRPQENTKLFASISASILWEENWIRHQCAHPLLSVSYTCQSNT